MDLCRISQLSSMFLGQSYYLNESIILRHDYSPFIISLYCSIRRLRTMKRMGCGRNSPVVWRDGQSIVSFRQTHRDHPMTPTCNLFL